MLLQRSDDFRKSPDCGRDGDCLGKSRDTLALVSSSGTVEMPHPGWDAVFAWVMTENMTGIRMGDRVVLMQLHWAAQLWGRA